MNLKKIRLVSFFLLIASVSSVNADSHVSLGLVLNGSGWNGDNGSGRSDFDSNEGGQFGFRASYTLDRLYFGLSLQGGDYQFNDAAPTQFTSGGELTASNVKLTHSDFDLLAGYYFWERVSLFLDLKSAGSEWQNNGYKQSFSGLGIGVSGFNPLSHKWTLYGSWGVVGGTIKQGDSTELGDGRSTALVLGANYTLSKNNYLNMGLKIRNYKFDYDDGNQQDYSINGLFVGYNHVFEL